MRTLILIVSALGMSLVAHAHGEKIEQRTGLKSAEVIKNELRLQGLDVSSVQIQGQTANIVATVSGEPLQLRMNRMTGALEQYGGKFVLNKKMLSAGMIELPVELRRPQLQKVQPIQPKLQQLQPTEQLKLQQELKPVEQLKPIEKLKPKEDKEKPLD